MNTKESSSKSTREVYDNLMNGYTPSPYVNTEWKQQNGFYQQYSVYDENCTSVSGTVNTIKAL